MTIKLLHIVGARPNFPKLAPVLRAGRAQRLDQRIVHTGQHYDAAMSDDFFRDLGIDAPDVNLEVGSHSHAVQTARIMERLEPVIAEERPDWVVVYGDINSTMAAAIVASKLGAPVAHVEAGLRSGDRAMPEEINRIITDRLADLLLTPSRDADATLRAEGEPDEEIAFIGNVMIDSLHYALSTTTGAARSPIAANGKPLVTVTLHRPSNVDDPDRLRAICAALRAIGKRHHVVFPMHPRTKQRALESGADLTGVDVLDPLGYVEMLGIVQRSHAVITDSGGLQEETTALGVPCLTVRENTERPITISEGTNRLVPNPAELPDAVAGVRREPKPRIPEGWDGHAGERAVQMLVERRRSESD